MICIDADSFCTYSIDGLATGVQDTSAPPNAMNNAVVDAVAEHATDADTVASKVTEADPDELHDTAAETVSLYVVSVT